MKKTVISGILGAVTLALGASVSMAANGDTLKHVREAGVVSCGTSQGLAGFSSQNQEGRWEGIDSDFCRAMAAAIFDDPEKVKFQPLSAKERFTALQSSEIDVLPRNTTWTMQRDTQNGIEFAVINFYDGQGMMVRKELGVNSALELSGATVCTNVGTTTEQNIADYFRANNMDFELVGFEKSEEVVAAYDSGRCDVYTTDTSGLASQRLRLADPAAHVILPEVISKEPLGPAVRADDPQWLNIMKWVHFAMINAEELGITQANVDEMLNSENPSIQRFLGKDGDDFGKALGLTPDWAYRIIKHVGNYGELYDRHVGPETEVGIPRGVNALWSKGGLQYAPPVR